jgi:hypothetical protein
LSLSLNFVSSLQARCDKIVAIFTLVKFSFKVLVVSYRGCFGELAEIFAIIYLYLSGTKSCHSQSFSAQVIYLFLIIAFSFPFALSFAVPADLELSFSLTLKSFPPPLFFYCAQSLAA